MNEDPEEFSMEYESTCSKAALLDLLDATVETIRATAFVNSSKFKVKVEIANLDK